MDLPAKFQPSLARRNFEEILIGRNFNSCVHLLLEKRQQSIFSLIIPFNPFPKKANNPPKRSHGSVLDLILAKLLDRTFKSIPVSHFRKNTQNVGKNM
jgi:S-adenosylmethionine:diacylglycerol 3-amino-3-carboxypropyl transferase